MASVVLCDVTKKFGDVTALVKINLDVKDKEFLVLVGPSGCGKSTTLRVIGGLEEITEGQVYIGDRLVNGVAPKDRNVSMVFQNYALYPHMNVYDNMAYGLRRRKYPKPEIKQKVYNAASSLGIERLLHRKPAQLSGGERQRVAVGRAIVRDPQVFLFDEPLSNLDAKLRVHMRSEIKKLSQKLETTTIYVTHDQLEAMTMGDRIVVMKDGLIQHAGKPLEVYNLPSNMFVAGFIGTPPMNFVPCTLKGSQNKLFADTDGFQLSIPASKSRLLNEGVKEAVLGIRPEHMYCGVSLSQNSKTSNAEMIKVFVELVQPLGAEMLLNCRTGDNTVVVKADSNMQVSQSDEIDIAIDRERIHLFDKKSGISLF
jgi:multiple sugar transport system ATP-binding protein